MRRWPETFFPRSKPPGVVERAAAQARGIHPLGHLALIVEDLEVVESRLYAAMRVAASGAVAARRPEYCELAPIVISASLYRSVPTTRSRES